ncbi:MAG: selenide, water dikinase SelD [Planctomycetota bacterium]
MPVDLFSIDCECGCAAKVSADRLADILREVNLPTRPEVLVGAETLDDAGIYQISDEQCLVQTIDFFPPAARDPYTYGQIAAANSLSDVYAMGGEPLMALAVVCFPAKTLDAEVLQEITKGAVDKLREAGAVLLGGHSIIDEQPKYGLAVTGVVNPADIMDNAHARPGDALILTKPLGTGITIVAAKAGMASREQEGQANRSMSALNADASRIARECGATSCTDVTGFGLLGHALQMARASGVSMEFNVDALPRLDGVLDYAAMGLLSAATYSNRAYVGDAARFDDDIALAEQDLLFDPQTSGGLLISCPHGKAEEAIRRGRERLSTPCAVIGTVTETEGETRIRIRRGR